MDLSINYFIMIIIAAFILTSFVGCKGKPKAHKIEDIRFKKDRKALITDSIDQNPSWAGKLLLNYPFTDSPFSEFRSTQYLGFFIDPTCRLSYRPVYLDAFFRNEGGMRVLDIKPESSGKGLFYVTSASGNQNIRTVYPTSEVLTSLCDQENVDLDEFGLPIAPGDTIRYAINDSEIKIISNNEEYYEVHIISGGLKTLLAQHKPSKRTLRQPWPLLLWAGDYNDDGFVDLLMKANIYPEYRIGDYVLLSLSKNGKVSIVGVFSTQVA